MTCANPAAPHSAARTGVAGPAVVAPSAITCPAHAPAAAAPPIARRSGDFYLLASITITFLAGSSAPTPLYPVYQSLWHFSPLTVTAVFASYALVLLAALLLTGRLSDHVGRKPVIVAAALVQVATMGLFAWAGSVEALFAARILQGLATGVAIAAVGAGMLDLDRARGTVANAVAPAMGTALGGFFSGLLVHFLPAPTLLVYAMLAVIYLLQAVGVALMHEPGERRPGAWRSLRPQLSAPHESRAALRAATPMLVAGWALAGFYASLGPALMQRVFGLDASLLGGLALFTLAGSAGLAVYVLRAVDAKRLVEIGALALLLGTAVVLAALAGHSASVFFVASALAGVGFGAGFQGGVRTVLASASAAQRAGVLSVVFVISYIAMGLPAVLAGLAVAYTGNLFATAMGLGGVVLVLAALALRAQAAPAPARQFSIPE
jgi:predicted MFS family arabinose efflux permease